LLEQEIMHLYFFLASSVAFSGFLLEIQNIRKLEKPSHSDSISLYFYTIALILSLPSSYIGLFHAHPGFEEITSHLTLWSTFSIAVSLVIYCLSIKGKIGYTLLCILCLGAFIFVYMTSFAAKKAKEAIEAKIIHEVKTAPSPENSKLQEIKPKSESNAE